MSNNALETMTRQKKGTMENKRGLKKYLKSIIEIKKKGCRK